MRGSFKKIIIAVCLAAILLITGAGMSLANGDNDQLISDLGPFFGQLHNLTPEQMEQAVEISDAMAQNFFNCLSDEEEAALKETLDIDYPTYLNMKNGLFDESQNPQGYIFSYSSGGATGYQGLLNAIDPADPDGEYIDGLIDKLHDSISPETLAQLNSKGISFDEFVMFMVKLSQIQFGAGLVVTDDVRDQFGDILYWLVSASDGELTLDDLTSCVPTVNCLSATYDQLTQDQKDQLEDILNNMGLIITPPNTPQVIDEQPADGATGVDVDANVSVTFDRDVTEGDLSGVVIDDGSSALQGVSAALNGRNLNISHPDFQFGTTYTVTIPGDCVQSGGDGNDEYEWNFTTKQEQESDVYNLTLDVQYDGDNDTVTADGILTLINGNTPIRDVSIGIVIEKDGIIKALGQMLTNQDGEYEFVFSTASLEAGTYTVTATANMVHAQKSFTIPSGTIVPPTVTTNSATGITTSGATLNGTIAANGGAEIDSYGFDWGTSPSALTNHVEVGASNPGSLPFNFSKALTGLTSDTTYYFIAYAHNSSGTSANTDVKTFTTNNPNGVPTVTTNSATGVTTSGATLNGTIAASGGAEIDSYGFDWGTSPSALTNHVEVGASNPGSLPFNFSKALTGLSCGSTYYFIAYARNSNGASENTDVKSFATNSCGGGGGGGGGGSAPTLDVDTYAPAADAVNVVLDTVVKVAFKQDIASVDLTKVSIIDADNNKVGGVAATVNGKDLIIAHDQFAYNTKYTVSVPSGTVKRKNYSVQNKSLSWSFTTAAEAQKSCAYSDVPESYWAAGVIKELCEKGILDGYPDGTFRPRIDITRGEFTKIIAVALGLAEENPATSTFKDVSPEDWYYGVVEAAAKAGLVKGYGKGEFKPNAKITREEITAILIRALGKADEAAANASAVTAFKDDHNISAWARGSVAVAVKEGIIKGYPNGTFGPGNNAIRAEVCAMVSRMLAKL